MAKVSVFEKTMQACRGIANSKPSKNLTEKKKISSKRFKKESDESDEEDDIMMDVQDDIVAVVDPDIDADEMTEVALGFQQLVDDAGANEIPETDEYLGDSICGCPVCGAKFFNEDPLTSGGKCPVCGNEADGFVSVGTVEKADTESDEESDEDSDKGDEEELDFSEAEIEISDEKKKARKESARRVRRPIRKESARTRRVRGGLNLDEKTFNRYLNKFIREHYKNAISFNVVGAKLKGTKLTLECAIKFKSGKTNKTKLVCNYNRNSRFMTARDSGVFKTESKSAPFMFKVTTRGNVIRCEGLKCKFVTTAKVKNESKKVQVTGTYVSESRKPTRRVARRTMESRRIRKPMARRTVESRVHRPMRRTARRVAESRRAIRRPLTHRTVESRRVRPTRRVRKVAESTRRVARRPMTRRAMESRRLATRRAVRPMRSESARVRKPVARRSASVRSESIRRARTVRGMRSESRMAKRNAIRRSTRR